MSDSYGLKKVLASYMLDELKRLIDLTGESAPGRKKAELVEFLGTCLTDEHKLTTYWERLDDISQKVVSHAFHHRGVYDEYAFFAQHQQVPERRRYPYSKYGRHRILLDLFIHNGRIPDGLMPLLAGLVQPKVPFRVEGQEEVPDEIPSLKEGAPLYTVETEWAGQQDLYSLLYLAGQKEMTVTSSSRKLNVSSVKKVGAMLSQEDFLPWVEPLNIDNTIRPLGLHQFAEHGGFMRKGKLTKQGKAYLESRDPELLLDAFEQWTEHGKFDEFNRVTGIKGRRARRTKFSPPGPRREAVVEALSWCPVGVWIDLKDFFRGILAWGFDVDVDKSEYPTLYVGWQTDGNLYRLGKAVFWDTVNGMYIRVLLFEYLATLGALDVVYCNPEDIELELHDYSMYHQLCLHQGLLYFRINPLGAYLFGQASEYSKPEDQELSFVIDELMMLCWSEGVALSPLIRNHLEGFTEPVEEGVYELCTETILSGLEAGRSLSATTNFINTYHKGPVPSYVTDWLKTIKTRTQAFKKSGTATIIQVRNSELVDLIMEDPNISRYAKPFGPRKIAIPSDMEFFFKRRVKELGYILLRGE